MIKNKKLQIAVFELTLAVMILIFSLTYIGFYKSDSYIGSHKVQVESFFTTIYINGEFRSIFMREDLSQTTITQNWNNLSYLLNSSFLSYELIISNGSINKTIFNCTGNLGKDYSSKVIAIENNTNYEFRKVIFGVCY